MKLAALLLVAIPGVAQFRQVEITFTPSGCESCTSSLPERMQRIRAVSSAAVEGTTLKVGFSAPNRVRLEQLRDIMEQDGTRAVSAVVEVSGELKRVEESWILETPAGARYRVKPASEVRVRPGTFIVRGKVRRLRADDGHLLIEAEDVQNPT